MIDRARKASSSVLEVDSVAHLLRTGQNTEEVEEGSVVLAMQTLIKAGVINIGARGLEPPTS